MVHTSVNQFTLFELLEQLHHNQKLVGSIPSVFRSSKQEIVIMAYSSAGVGKSHLSV